MLYTHFKNNSTSISSMFPQGNHTHFAWSFFSSSQVYKKISSQARKKCISLRYCIRLPRQFSFGLVLLWEMKRETEQIPNAIVCLFNNVEFYIISLFGESFMHIQSVLVKMIYSRVEMQLP